MTETEPGAEGFLERAAELGLLRDAVAGAAGGSGRLVIVEGAAGIGKSALIQRAQREAEAAGMEVLRARGLELELEFAYGVARQLFESTVMRASPDRQRELLAGAAGLVRPLLKLERRRDEPAPAAIATRVAPDIGFTLVHGLYWLTANLADRAPLLIAVDDAHYADAATLRFIAYLAARCDELPVLLVLGVRSGDPTAVRELLTRLRGGPDTTVLTPGALSAEAVAVLVRTRLGDTASDEFCGACAGASAGNPFLLSELLAQLEADGLSAGAVDASRVDGVQPDSVARSVLARLERLGPAATALARAVAVLESATLQQAATLAGVDPAAATAVADDLVAAQILAAEPLRFVHPLLRRSIYEQIPPTQRGVDHRRAALLLAGARATITTVGTHLLRAAPAGDPEVLGLLRRAAAVALAEGDSGVATALLRRALQEPPGDDTRGVVLAELGQAEALAHDPAAGEHLTEALELAQDPRMRAAVACALGELLVWSSGRSVEAYEMLTRTLELLGTQAPAPLRAAVETLRLATASVDARLVAQVAPQLARIHELADAAGPAGRALKIFEACWAAQGGRADFDWRARLDQGLDGGRFVADHTGGSPIVVYAAIVLVLADELERAQALLGDVRADARARGSILSHLVDVAWGSLLSLRRGELPRAVADAQAALTLAQGIDAGWVQVWLVAALAEALREQGQIERAAAIIDSVSLESAIGTSAALHALIARGRVRAAEGDHQRAVADLRQAGENVIVNNPSFAPWRAELAMLLAASDPDEALELARLALARARELGQPRGIGVALRAQARVLGGEQALPLLEEAVETLRRSPARLELAYALADHGAALRRSGSRAAAREPLREALELARRCGAEPLAQVAHQELLASGAHPRREALSGPAALTPSERRVADLAASGLANREIAQALFVTSKTVGTHLAHIYQKLDLSGQQARERLAERLQAQEA